MLYIIVLIYYITYMYITHNVYIYILKPKTSKAAGQVTIQLVLRPKISREKSDHLLTLQLLGIAIASLMPNPLPKDTKGLERTKHCTHWCWIWVVPCPVHHGFILEILTLVSFMDVSPTNSPIPSPPSSCALGPFSCDICTQVFFHSGRPSRSGCCWSLTAWKLEEEKNLQPWAAVGDSPSGRRWGSIIRDTNHTVMKTKNKTMTYPKSWVFDFNHKLPQVLLFFEWSVWIMWQLKV